MFQRIKDKIKLNTVIRLIPAVLFLEFIIFMSMHTMMKETVKDTIKQTEISLSGAGTLSDRFEGVLQENFYDKNYYINLNGLTTRILGINTLNERQKLTNGHLTENSAKVETFPAAEKLMELDHFLGDRNIDFVYVLAPHKSAFYDSSFAPGYSSDSSENIDSMMTVLNMAGVNSIDMNAWFEENEWTMDDVYFKTDHHWRPQAGLAAAKETMSFLSGQGIADYDEELLDENNYTIMTLKDWFLGSHGKRVGTYYAGVDDINVYFPNFAVDYTFSGLGSDTHAWQYFDTLLDDELMTKKDYFNNSPYSIYMHHDYPIRITFNTEAQNQKRLLLMGDSFKMPFEYFLTTQFQEVYTIDLRYYIDGTFAEYLEEVNPDIVIMCTQSTGYGPLYDFGIIEYKEALQSFDEDATEIAELGNASFSAQASDGNNFKAIYGDLELGKTYTLTLDSTYYSGDDESYVQMTLQDLTTNEPVYSRYFNANSNETQKWIFTVPTPEDNIENNNHDFDVEDMGDHVYAIYLYAGTKEHYVKSTEDEEDEEENAENGEATLSEPVTVEVQNVRIQEGIVEE